MNNATTIVIGILIGAILGGGGVYAFTKSPGDMASQDKKLSDNMAMMKGAEEGLAILSKQMTKSGMMVQEMGMKYKDAALVSEGKDLVAIGERYQMELYKTNAMMMGGGEMMKK